MIVWSFYERLASGQALQVCYAVMVSFFFFQAEDGIRDLTVTGVQTCALPIYRRLHDPRIRLATNEDIPALKELIGEAVGVLGARYYTPAQIRSGLSHIFGVDTQLIVDATYFVAEVEATIVGGGGWSKRKTHFGCDQSKGNEVERLLYSET